MTDQPHSLLVGFESLARRDFEDRLARVRDKFTRYLTTVPAGGDRFDVRELAVKLTTMPDPERYVLLRRLVSSTDGPANLEGMESLMSFLAEYMLDDGECSIVPEPDVEDLDEDPFYSTALDFVRGDMGPLADESEVQRVAHIMYVKRGRPMVLVPCSGGDRALAPDVIEAIRYNHAMEERRLAAYGDYVPDESGPSGP